MGVGGSEAVERASAAGRKGAAIGCSGEDCPLDAAPAAGKKGTASGFRGGDPELVMAEAGKKSGASGLSGMVMVVGGGCGGRIGLLDG